MLNSELRLRLDNKMEENHYLLKQFFERNKQNQEMINEINHKYRAIQRKNRRKLEHHKNLVKGLADQAPSGSNTLNNKAGPSENPGHPSRDQKEQ